MPPVLTFPPELLLAAQGVRVAFFDVDGVLTDGGLYLSEAGDDGRDSKPLRARLQALGIDHVHYGTEDKLPAASVFSAAAIGDDWPDLPVLGRCAFAAAPPNAHAEVKARVRYVTTAAGGHGAAREFCDLLLVAGGRYAQLLEAAS
jgi:3-deoxy-D-manno-octulosonate 8-phosphate phosphatase (KDO 8-P phosphatase)